jgi:uncharacterized OB-fold protein
MSEKTPGAPVGKPIPIPDDASREFFEGAKHGRLMLQRCGACGNYRFHARDRCDVCRSRDYTWEAASGRATVISHAVMHQRYHPAFYDELPYPLAVVELEEGPRLITSVVGVEADHLKAGMAMKAVFEDFGEGVVLPRFTPG